MTAAQKSALRFQKSPCPAKPSRKKLRQLMPHNRAGLTAKMLDEPKNPFHIKDRKRGVKRHWRAPQFVDKSANLQTFIDMLESLGGKYEVLK